MQSTKRKPGRPKVKKDVDNPIRIIEDGKTVTPVIADEPTPVEETEEKPKEVIFRALKSQKYQKLYKKFDFIIDRTTGQKRTISPGKILQFQNWRLKLKSPEDDDIIKFLDESDRYGLDFRRENEVNPELFDQAQAIQKLSKLDKSQLAAFFDVNELKSLNLDARSATHAELVSAYLALRKHVRESLDVVKDQRAVQRAVDSVVR